MLERIKKAIRIYHDELNDDIQFNIDACMLDLQRVGISANVASSNSDDALICKAAELYVKWLYDFNGKGEQCRTAYEKLRDAISLCQSYNNESEE